jgi:transcriptional regulator of acetoin/glycerol metabolism
MVGTIRLYPAAWVIQAGDVVCRAERLLQMFVLMPSFRTQIFWRRLHALFFDLPAVQQLDEFHSKLFVFWGKLMETALK